MNPRRSRRSRRLLAAFAALPILLWLGAGTASAHAILESVDPPDGSTLVTAPAVVRLVFSEPVEAGLATIELLDAAGHAVPGITVGADPTDATAIDVTMPHLAASAYRIAWRVVDEVDFHVTTGTIVFGVGVPAPATVVEPAATADVVAEVEFRWLAIALLAAACGSLLLLAVTDRLPGRASGSATASAAAPRRRLLLVATAGTSGAVVANAGLLFLQASGAAGAGVGASALLATSYGVAWAIEQALLVLLLVVLVRAMGRPSGAPTIRVALLGGLLLGLAGAQALTGHVATGAPGETPIRWVALTAHLVAMLAWVGGLVALAIAVGPLLRGPRADTGLARAVLGRFWLVAAPSLAVLAVTGVYLGGQLVASADALLLTGYGQALIVKTGLALVAVSLGALNAAALHPGLAARFGRAAPFLAGLVPPRSRVRALVTLEAGAALAVVLAAALMSASPPARGPRFDPLPATVEQPPVAARAGDLMVTLAIRPDRPGPNFVDVGVLDTRRPAPAPIGKVTLRLVPPAGGAGSVLEARPSAPGHYEVDNLAIDQGGAWRLAVVIDRAGLPAAAVDFPWTVAPPLAAPRPVVVSDAPLAPVATPVAIVLAVVLGSLLAAAAVRRRAPRLRRPSAALAVSPPASPAGSES